MTGAEEYKLMQSRLHQLRQRAKRTGLASGLTALVSLTVILSFFIMSVEAVFRLSSPGRFILVSLWAGMLFFFFVYWIFLPLISYLFRKDQPDDDELALRIGEHHPVRDRLANALQVFRQIEARAGLSKDLAHASLHDACRETHDLDFQKAASPRKMFMYIRFLLISIVAFSVVYVLFHAPLSAAWGRLWSPQKDYPLEPLFSLTLLPGNTRVIQGDSVEIRVEAEGSVPSRISLLVREEEESSFREIGLSPPFRHSFPGMRNTIN